MSWFISSTLSASQEKIIEMICREASKCHRTSFYAQTHIEKIHFLSIIWHGFVLLLQTWRRRINSFRIHFFFSFGSRMSFLTSLSYKVSLSTLLLSRLHAAVFWFIFVFRCWKFQICFFTFVRFKKQIAAFCQITVMMFESQSQTRPSV